MAPPVIECGVLTTWFSGGPKGASTVFFYLLLTLRGSFCVSNIILQKQKGAHNIGRHFWYLLAAHRIVWINELLSTYVEDGKDDR